MTEQRQPRERKSVEGRVTKVDTEKHLLWVKPQNEGIRRFRYRPEKLEVTLEGEVANLKDIEKGQLAEVTFVERAANEANKGSASRAVKLSLRGWR